MGAVSWDKRRIASGRLLFEKWGGGGGYMFFLSAGRSSMYCGWCVHPGPLLSARHLRIPFCARSVLDLLRLP